MQVLGIDVGGSGVKGAPVDCRTGELTADRHRIPTPHPATPSAVSGAVAEIVRHFEWRGPIGCGLPCVIREGRTLTAANLHKSWIGIDARSLLSAATGCPVRLLNDADAAGLAEMRFGAGRERAGTVLMLTLGTGIGSAVFVDGALVPNTELGHLEVGRREAERWASDRARKEKDLGWSEWSKRLRRVLEAYHALLWPELVVIGGGVIKKQEKFLPRLSLDHAEIVSAALGNQAGIVGAALAAAEEAPAREDADASPPTGRP